MKFLFSIAALVILSSCNHAPPEYGPDNAATADGLTAMTTLTWTKLLFLS
jgi:hypothetical protein